MLANAFNAMLSRHSRTVSISRPGGDTVEDFKITPSNYHRQTSAPSDMVIEGREFLVSKKRLETIPWEITHGDQFIDPDMGTLTIVEIIEMFDLGGTIMGYRVRTN